MANAPGEDWWPDEAEYRRYLGIERRLFALALCDYGGMSPEQAEGEALARYPYEPPDTPYRGMIFHDLPWDCAMRRLYGNTHSMSLTEMPEAFRLASEGLHQSA